MKKSLDDVQEFHLVFDQQVLTRPTIPTSEVEDLRYNLVKEEAKEFLEALKAWDVVKMLDAHCDLIYVLNGTAHAFGYAHLVEQAWDLVHASNMAKSVPCVMCDGKKWVYRELTLGETTRTSVECPLCKGKGRIVRRRESDNKVLKPDGWREPDLASLVRDVLMPSDILECVFHKIRFSPAHHSICPMCKAGSSK